MIETTANDGYDSEAEGSGLLNETRSSVTMEAETRTVNLFTKIYTLTVILGILSVGLMCVWVGLYRGGFGGRSHPQLEFNWHPLCMVVGLIFLYGNGALVFRAFRAEQKKKLKILHACFHFGAFVFTVVGLVTVFDSHNLNTKNGSAAPIPNLYSLHSWIGLTVVLLFCCQWLCGMLTFLFPGLRPAIRSAYMPVHQFFGVAIFVGAVAAALLGLNQKAFFALSVKYSERSAEGILINMIGLFLMVFGGLVVYLVTYPLFRRRTTEEELLLTDTTLD